MVCYSFVWFGWYGGGCQMISEFIHGEISMLLHMIDYLQSDHSISTTILGKPSKEKNKKCGFFPHTGGGVNPKSTLF